MVCQAWGQQPDDGYRDPGYVPLEFEELEEPKERISFRTILTRLHLNVGTGYGRTFYKHDLDGFTVVRREDGTQYIIQNNGFSLTDTVEGFREWVNLPERNLFLIDQNSDSIVSSDTSSLTYRAGGGSLPFEFTLQYVTERFRAGIGAGLEFHSIGQFTPSAGEEVIGPLSLSTNSSTFTRLFVTFGGVVLDRRKYDILADLRIGTVGLGGGFDNNLVDKGLFFNIGVGYEYHFSEIFRAWGRFAYDAKNYTMTLPGTGVNIQHNQPALFLQFGVSFNLPALKRCPVDKCHTQINHMHEGKEYRSKRHPFWKMQNPHYGENNPTLIPHKRKNRRKKIVY